MFNFIICPNKFMENANDYDQELRFLLAMHTHTTKPKPTIKEAIDDAIKALEKMKDIDMVDVMKNYKELKDVQ